MMAEIIFKTVRNTFAFLPTHQELSLICLSLNRMHIKFTHIAITTLQKISNHVYNFCGIFLFLIIEKVRQLIQ